MKNVTLLAFLAVAALGITGAKADCGCGVAAPCAAACPCPMECPTCCDASPLGLFDGGSCGCAAAVPSCGCGY
jgi:hypothetical protein